jgi:hypothetical protein
MTPNLSATFRPFTKERASARLACWPDLWSPLSPPVDVFGLTHPPRAAAPGQARAFIYARGTGKMRETAGALLDKATHGGTDAHKL